MRTVLSSQYMFIFLISVHILVHIAVHNKALRPITPNLQLHHLTFIRLV
jgi:hypothetical protein